MAGTFLRKKENFSMFLEDTVNGVPVQKCHCPGTDTAGHNTDVQPMQVFEEAYG